MSKNERLVRTFIAGIVFASVGIVATIFDSGKRDASSEITRAPASRRCASNACIELVRLKKELLAKPGADATGDRTLQVDADARESKLLNDAGVEVITIFADREADEIAADEIDEVARFLAETTERDGAGIVLDALEIGIGTAKAKVAIRVIKGAVERLCDAKRTPNVSDRIKSDQCSPILLSLAANLSEGQPETPPTPAGK